jgi:glycosyltransferase involved in cell wall biosynthesis
MGFQSGSSPWRALKNLAKLPFSAASTNGYATTWLLDHLAHHVPTRTVSNAWLKTRFGGTVIPHVRDARLLNPEQVDASALRQELDMTQGMWVGFIGTVRPHKGLEDLISALKQAPSELGLFLAGLGDDPFAQKIEQLALAELGASRVRVMPPFAFGMLGLVNSVPDIICVPSRDERGSRGQIPAKLFDALAMAKPVVVTAVNDMPAVVGDAGLTVAPSEPAQLAAAFAKLMAAPELRACLGARARQRFLENYAYESALPVLRKCISQIDPVGRGVLDRAAHSA